MAWTRLGMLTAGGMEAAGLHAQAIGSQLALEHATRPPSSMLALALRSAGRRGTAGPQAQRQNGEVDVFMLHFFPFPFFFTAPSPPGRTACALYLSAPSPVCVPPPAIGPGS